MTIRLLMTALPAAVGLVERAWSAIRSYRLLYLESWPGLSRPSTPLKARKKDVDARDKRGHDAGEVIRSRKPDVPAAARAHHQLGFGSGGYTGTAGTNPFRFGISTFGRLLASMTSVSWMMPFRYNRNATTA